MGNKEPKNSNKKKTVKRKVNNNNPKKGECLD